MPTRTYWLDLFTSETWKEFLDAGGTVSGFRDGRWATVQQLQPGDYLLCYLVGSSRFIGVLEVVGKAFTDNTPIWKKDAFPCRVHVKVVVRLSAENAIPINELKERLSFFDSERPLAWTGHVRGSPVRWKAADGEAIVQAVRDRIKNPRPRPVPPLPRLPKAVPTGPLGLGPVIVPDNEEQAEAKESSLHTEIQGLLLKLGNDIGLDVWVARNDRSREVNGQAFTELPRFKRELPLQFDEATTRTIELIDVLWLRGNAIVAAFEIECTTSVYSGLLRMSDLIAMQPNLRIPLYLVAPDDRRNKVMTEVNRPTFSRLKPPMNELCKFISIPTLREHITRATPFVRHLRPEFMDEFAESCELDEV